MKPLVIYHGPDCMDGFGAAYAAWTKFGDEAEYFPMNYGEWKKLFEEYPQGGSKFDGRDVYILDFSFDPLQTKVIVDGCTKLVWLDHHKIAFDNWCGESYLKNDGPLYTYDDSKTVIVLDNNRSGALIAWEHFNPGVEPQFIKYIDDYDRWQFKLPGSKAFHSGMSMLKPWKFEQWDELYTFSSVEDKILSEGEVILKAYDQQIKSIANRSRGVRIEFDFDLNWWGHAVNTNVHISEVGHELAKKSNSFGLVWYLGEGNQAKCSLRSNGDYDVSAIAKQFGGGGHKNASGFSVPIETLLEWLK